MFRFVEYLGVVVTLDQLQAIKITIEMGSVADAAKRLGRAPSAVSMAIKKLEQLWGVQVFDRSEYRLKLTAAGEVLYPKILKLLEGSRDLQKHTKNLSSRGEPNLRISFNSLFPMHFIDSLLKQIRNRFPAVQMEINVDQMERPLKRLLSKEVDFAVTSFEPSQSKLLSKKILDIELISMGSKDYIKNSNISKNELLTKNQIIVGVGSRNSSNQKAGVIGSHYSWTVADFPTKLNLLRKGLGFGYLPDYMVDKDLKKGKLIEIKCMSRVHVPIFIYSPSNEIIGECRKYFWEELTNATGDK